MEGIAWLIAIFCTLIASMIIMTYMYMKKAEDQDDEIEQLKGENLELRSWALDALYHLEMPRTFANQKQYDEETRRIEKRAQDLELM